MSKPRFDIIKIEAYHCYKCGSLFAEKGKRKTGHHSIPVFLKPQRNVEVPVCDDCHKEINKYTVQSLPKFDAMQNLIDNLRNAIAKWDKVLGRYNQEEKTEDE